MSDGLLLRRGLSEQSIPCLWPKWHTQACQAVEQLNFIFMLQCLQSWESGNTLDLDGQTADLSAFRRWEYHILYRLRRSFQNRLLLGRCRTAQLTRLGRLVLGAGGQRLGQSGPPRAAQQRCSRWLLGSWHALLAHLGHWAAVQIREGGTCRRHLAALCTCVWIFTVLVAIQVWLIQGCNLQGRKPLGTGQGQGHITGLMLRQAHTLISIV